MWTAADITIVLDDSLSVGSVVTATIRTPEGDPQIIADVERFDRELVLGGVHIQSGNLRPNQLGWARLRQLAQAVAETADVDTPLWLKERLGPRVRYVEGSVVRSGSPACYHLRADSNFTKTVSAAIALAKRHLPMPEAKLAAEHLVHGQEALVDLPMLEDAALFEREMRELSIRAVKEISAAADG